MQVFPSHIQALLICAIELSAVHRHFGLCGFSPGPTQNRQTIAKDQIHIVNPVSRDFVLIRTNANLLNRVLEHDCLTFFVLRKAKCKPMHSERERFSDVFVLHRTKCKPMHVEWECFSDERVCAASTVQPLVISMSIFLIF